LEEVVNGIFNLELVCYQEIIGGRQVEKLFYKSIRNIYVFWRGDKREKLGQNSAVWRVVEENKLRSVNADNSRNELYTSAVGVQCVTCTPVSLATILFRRLTSVTTNLIASSNNIHT